MKIGENRKTEGIQELSPTAKKLRALATLGVPLFAIVVIISRVSRLLMHPNVVEIGAIVVSMALVASALIQFVRGNFKRTVLLFGLEAVASTFVLVSVDVPWIRDASPALTRAAIIHITAPIDDLRGDHAMAAMMRVNAKTDGLFSKYSGAQPKIVVASGGCQALEQFQREQLDSEPQLARSLSRLLGACAAASGDERKAVTLYAMLQNENDFTVGATYAAWDGYPAVAAAAIRVGTQSADPTQRNRSCRIIDRARDTSAMSHHRSVLDEAIEESRLQRCNSVG